MLVGYARVSTVEQHLELQIDALKEAGCKRIFQDRVSRSVKNLQNLKNALGFVRSGDILVV